MDIFNSTVVIYEDLKMKCKQINFTIFFYNLVDSLVQEQQKRIMPKFDEDENKRIDRKIKELVIDMTRVKNMIFNLLKNRELNSQRII